MDFGITAGAVLVMLIYAVPGFVLVKTKAVKEEHISSFAKVLLYVCQPCLTMYQFNSVTYEKELFKNMLLFFGICTALQIVILAAVGAVFGKRLRGDVGARIAVCASVFGNVGYFGVPLLEKLLPGTNALAYSAMFAVSMNLMAWTLGCALITCDKKYVKVKKLVFNPATLVLFVALPLFFTGTKLPTEGFDLGGIVSLLAKMTAPLCMLILGMRLATVSVRELFSNGKCYLSSAVKLVIFPLAAWAITLPLNIPELLKQVLCITCCCPTASVVLNLSELFGEGQKQAADSVLLSTIFCLLTIPVILLIL